MRLQIHLAILLLFSAGCSPLSVRDDEIDWRFPVLAKDGCPNLTGKYYTYEGTKYPTGTNLFFWLTRADFFTPTPGIPVLSYSPVQGVNVINLNPSVRKSIYWTVIKQSDVFMDATMLDEKIGRAHV